MLEWPTSSGRGPEDLETDAVRVQKLTVDQEITQRKDEKSPVGGALGAPVC